MNHLRKKDHVYDVVIVGAGLSGLVAASSLVKRGWDVCVLESTDFPGGHSRAVYSPIGLVDNGIKFFPDNGVSLGALESLKLLLPMSVEVTSVENGPITYQNGEIKPFVGFGKEAPEFHRELAYFLEPRRLELSMSVGKIVAQLSADLGDRIFPGATVTKYLGQDSRISAATVNGQKQIFGRGFIHAASPRLMATLLADEIMSPRAKQKIAKAPYWTILGLDIFHSGLVSERSELHLLNGTTHDELGPCVGQFHPLRKSEKGDGFIQHSQWMTFIDHEGSEDPELVSTVLKKIKRQIKRAYPEALNNILSERILVAPLAEAELDLKSDKHGAFAGIENLWLAHGTASNHLNLVGAIHQACYVADQVSGGMPRSEVRELELV
jgi:hypothetical protein